MDRNRSRRRDATPGRTPISRESRRAVKQAMDDIEPEWMKRIATLMAVNCVTNPVKGRISEGELAALNK
ncbi:MAG: hypothetical protein FJ319_05740 [SAR202 cluster bacterium]|nr:hypothetical protein [SAR202 cluster bacterium]